jgi:fatty-acyl-CoA synthase
MLKTISTLARAGLLRPVIPTPRLARVALELPFRTPNLGTAVAAQAALQPHRRAVVDARGAVTWSELDARCSRLANTLLGLAAEGSRVAFMLRNTREMIECYVACGRAGMVAAPVNTWSPGLEVRHVLATQQPAVIVADNEFADVLDQAGVDATTLWVSGDDGYEAAVASAPARPPRVRGGTRIVTHTSGTTGRPKAAERDLAASAASLQVFLRLLEAVPLRRDDTVLIAPPLFHAFGQGLLAAALVLGQTVAVRPRFDPVDAVETAHREDVTVAALVPVMLARLIDVDDRPPPRLRAVVVSGSALPTTLRDRAEARLGRVLYDLYGSTEVGFVAVAGPKDHERKPGSVGRPLSGMQAFAVDDNDRVLPPGEAGRLHVKTGFEFAGYTGGEDPPPQVDGATALGDTGYVDEDGYLYVTGREDEMVITGGENVYPTEVEAVLETHPDITESAVVGVGDEEYGQILHAFVVAGGGADVTEGDVIEHVRRHLSRYKTPRRVTFVDALPRDAVGKVRKRDLRV